MAEAGRAEVTERDWDKEPRENQAEDWVNKNLKRLIERFGGEEGYIIVDSRKKDGLNIVVGIPVSRFAKMFAPAIKEQEMRNEFSMKKLIQFSQREKYNLEETLSKLKKSVKES